MKDIFKDKNGKTVIAQSPNLPIKVWFAAWLLGFLPAPSQISTALELISFGAIFTWAWLEIFEGVNTWRRILGGIVMLVIITLRI